MARTDGDNHVASIYSVSATFPFKNRFLGQFDMSFVSVVDRDDIVDATGDLMFRTRMRIAGPVAGVALLRTGSGSNLVFPYASGTVDLELGLAVVDTVQFFGPRRPMTWWVAATTLRVIRNTDSLRDLHKNHAKMGAGVVLRPLRRFRLDVSGGIFGYWFEDGPTRQVVLTELDYAHSSALAFFGTVQAELGSQEYRPNDVSGVVGIRVTY